MGEHSFSAFPRGVMFFNVLTLATIPINVAYTPVLISQEYQTRCFSTGNIYVVILYSEIIKIICWLEKIPESNWSKISNFFSNSIASLENSKNSAKNGYRTKFLWIKLSILGRNKRTKKQNHCATLVLILQCSISDHQPHYWCSLITFYVCTHVFKNIVSELIV